MNKDLIGGGLQLSYGAVAMIIFLTILPRGASDSGTYIELRESKIVTPGPGWDQKGS